MSGTFDDLVAVSGYLADKEIAASLQAGHLIDPGSWDASQIRHASYTIRLGSRVEIERAADVHTGLRQRLSIALVKGGDPLELRPGDTAMLYCMEYLRLPPSVMGFTVARGLWWFESIVPENTYVDPGFSGQIYTTVTNLSSRVFKIPYGTPIARLFFFKLGHDVDQPYKPGPSIGIDQHLPSEPWIAFTSAALARKASNKRLLGDLVSTERGGLRTAELFRRQTVLLRAGLLVAIIWPIALVTTFHWDWLRGQIGTLASAVVIDLVAGLLVFLGLRAWAKLKHDDDFGSIQRS